MMNKMKEFYPQFKSLKILVLLITVAVFLGACSTKPVKTSRRGLFSSDDTSIVSNAQSTSTNPDELYAPKEGERVSLSGKWQWPIENGVEISSPFGQRGRKFHQGVDIRAHMGTPVHAAADGDVVYVGSKIKGYGRMVVIKHAHDIYSVYAHHSKNLVKIGKHVIRGDVIAKSGHSGHATGPHLHFEIRRGTQSFDPQYALNENIHSIASRSVASDSKKRN